MDRIAVLDQITDTLDALSPVVRGDEQALSLHREAAEEIARAEKLLMAEVTLEMAGRRPSLVHRRTTDLALCQARNRLRLLDIRYQTPAEQSRRAGDAGNALHPPKLSG